MQERSIVAFPHDAAQSRYQFRPGRTQLVVMMKRQLSYHFLALGGERQQHLAAVLRSPRPMNEPTSFQAVHQFHGAVVADLQPAGQLSNPRTHSRRHSLDCQHHLILAAFHPGLLYRLLAEVKKAANLVTEFRQRLIVRQTKLLHREDCIVLRSTATFIVYRKTI
jgi:hypothetical protein